MPRVAAAKVLSAVDRVPLRWRVAYLVGVVLVAAVIIGRGLGTGGPGAGDDIGEHGRTCPHAPDLSRRAVNGVDLSQQQVPCVNLERATVTGTVQEADLSRANLHRANLRSLWLDHVDLSDADLAGAAAESANLTRVKLERADLRQAGLARSRLENVGLQGARLGGADLRAAALSRSDLGGADVRGADLSGASLFDSNLRGARLDRAKLTNTVWSDVICPDGTKSAGDARESCDRHLTPAR
ncbi:pentapeptide repeat-containing protein [Planosporangium sp. 12N6]|uniref:pentapeptide repeat-containing protein n=1 Tax=Planosporangium spinosum TaxID=3402278 RepID=UPI003CF23D27